MVRVHDVLGWRDRRRVSAGIAGAVLASIFVSGAVVLTPILAFAPLLILLMGLLLVNERFRLAFVVFGALLTLHTSQEVTPVKAVYLVGVGIALFGAIFQAMRFEARAPLDLFRPLLFASVLLFLMLAVSFVVALAHQTSPEAWLRDVAPYFLFATIPIFALDQVRRPTDGGLIIMFILAGVLVATSFTLSWLDQRQFAQLGLNRLVLPSLLLPMATWCYAIAKVVQEKGGQFGWVVLIVLIPALLLATGTRSTFVLLAALVGMVVALKEDLIRKFLRMAAVIVVSGLSIFVLVQAIGEITGTQNEQIAARFASIAQVVVAPDRDQSYLERSSELSAAWNVFIAEPFLGSGPGHPFTWRTASGLLITSFNIDNALSFPAKFGAAGLAVLLVVAFGYASFLRGLSRYQAKTAKLALVGYLAIVVAYFPLGSPFEDKGFSLGLLFLLILPFHELAAGRATRRTDGTASNRTALLNAKP